MKGREVFNSLLQAVDAQGSAFEKRAKSRVEKQYADVMQMATDVLVDFTQTATFDEILWAEKAFQENDILIYAQRPATLEAVQEGIDDFKDGEEVYKQLLEDTEAYKGHRYRKKDRILPAKVIPIDTMRKALRGQVKRIENYRKNVMGNLQEQEFMSARIAMLRRAEKLYDGIQRERLLPPESDA